LTALCSAHNDIDHRGGGDGTSSELHGEFGARSLERVTTTFQPEPSPKLALCDLLVEVIQETHDGGGLGDAWRGVEGTLGVLVYGI
jgi:hypothetical protein